MYTEECAFENDEKGKMRKNGKKILKNDGYNNKSTENKKIRYKNRKINKQTKQL